MKDTMALVELCKMEYECGGEQQKCGSGGSLTGEVDLAKCQNVFDLLWSPLGDHSPVLASSGVYAGHLSSSLSLFGMNLSLGSSSLTSNTPIRLRETLSLWLYELRR